ncbi:MAG: hypothetical protein O4753_07360 [Trichodesmium sp. St7_bin2_1]|nr:hypothetical protein [Trichodesmium sp. St7_bin2_1]
MWVGSPERNPRDIACCWVRDRLTQSTETGRKYRRHLVFLSAIGGRFYSSFITGDA